MRGVTDGEVYRIINRATGKPEGVYSRAYHDEYNFKTAEDAINSNCYGIFENSLKYKISRYHVT